MRKELADFEAEEIIGGTVLIAESLGLVGFTNLGASYVAKGDFKTMRDAVFAMEDANPTMNGKDFDILVRDTFLANGWI